MAQQATLNMTLSLTGSQVSGVSIVNAQNTPLFAQTSNQSPGIYQTYAINSGNNTISCSPPTGTFIQFILIVPFGGNGFYTLNGGTLQYSYALPQLIAPNGQVTSFTLNSSVGSQQVGVYWL